MNINKKKIVIFVAVIAVVATGIFAPKLIHKCDRCSRFFFGTGYDGSVNRASDENEMIICEDCAETVFADLLAWGVSLDQFKRGLF